MLVYPCGDTVYAFLAGNVKLNGNDHADLIRIFGEVDEISQVVQDGGCIAGFLRLGRQRSGSVLLVLRFRTAASDHRGYENQAQNKGNDHSFLDFVGSGQIGG